MSKRPLEGFGPLVSKTFKNLRLTPYPGQEDLVINILESFYTKGSKNVILSADTGTGKSIIGAVVACCISEIEDEQLASFILMNNNALVQQYSRTFDSYGDHKFFQIKGASNYPCDALRKFTQNKDANAESCVVKQVSDAVKSNVCDQCEYAIAKRQNNRTENLITNYSYYLVSKLWSRHLQDRCLTIFDEAHTLNDVFCSHSEIYVSEERLTKTIEEVKSYFGIEAQASIEMLVKLKNGLQLKRLNESNYTSFVTHLLGAYKDISSLFAKKAEKEQDLTQYDRLAKMAKKYFNFGCKIGDFLEYEFDHSFEFNEETLECHIKPIFVGKMSKVILGPKNLFMSATISKEFMVQTLDLDEAETDFVKAPSAFPKENKTVVFYQTQTLNYQGMKDPDVVSNMLDSIVEIVTQHAKETRESGIILTPSFYVTDSIAHRLKKISGVNVIAHGKGSKAADCISKFKSAKTPTVLISPSIYEGIDLPGDLSRFQIIVKAPYPSLGDARMQKIAADYGQVYRMITLMKVIQGIGRSIRSTDDWAVTYILDKNAENLFKSGLNVWIDQFEVI